MEAKTAVAALAALAQDTRLDVFRLLVETGRQGLPAGRIGETLGLPGATLSFHLNQLRQAGLVDFERQGRSLVYAACYPAMDALVRYLTENCCRSNPDDCTAAHCKPDRLPSANIRSNRNETRTRARSR